MPYCHVTAQFNAYDREQARMQAEEEAVETCRDELNGGSVIDLFDRIEAAANNHDRQREDRRILNRIAEDIDDLIAEAAEYLV